MSKGALTVRLEEPNDIPAIHRINTAAFDRADEADLVDRLRADGDLILSLVCETTDGVCGHIAFSRMVAEDKRLRVSALAPMAVSPGRQKAGVGSSLIRDALRRLAEDGEDLVLVLGDPEYYGRFGFKAEDAVGVKTPYDGPYQQAIGLTPQGRAYRGTLNYAAAFAALG